MAPRNSAPRGPRFAFDTPLDITRELFAQNQVLSTDRTGRAEEQDAQSQDVRDDSEDCSRGLQHASIMPEPTRICRHRLSTDPRRKLLRTTVGSQ